MLLGSADSLALTVDLGDGEYTELNELGDRMGDFAEIIWRT